MTSRRFSLSIPQDLADWLEREAARQGRTRNNLIRLILEKYRKNRQGTKEEESDLEY